MTTAPTEVHTDLSIDGMTCATCALRVEKRLNRLEGVHATVNYATERARVTHHRSVSPDALVAAVEATGYTATVPAPAGMPDHHAERPGGGHQHDHSAHRRGDAVAPRRTLVVSSVLAAPVVLLAMVPALQFDAWQWLSPHPRRPGRGVGRVAVPPGDVGQPAPRRRHDGHADLARRAGRLRLVALRPVLRAPPARSA